MLWGRLQQTRGNTYIWIIAIGYKTPLRLLQCIPPWQLVVLNNYYRNNIRTWYNSVFCRNKYYRIYTYFIKLINKIKLKNQIMRKLNLQTFVGISIFGSFSNTVFTAHPIFWYTSSYGCINSYIEINARLFKYLLDHTNFNFQHFFFYIVQRIIGF